MSDRLREFVHEALGRGLPRDQIESASLRAGWRADEIEAALDEFVELDFPIPVPRPKPYISARDAFGYLVLFSTLYTSATALIQLLYQFINRAFPDPAQADVVWRSHSESMRWSTAALVIAFPVYFALSRRSYLDTRRDPEQRTSKIRKWLTYLTLFIAAATLLCDGISLVYYLLGGELTVRFLLKVLTIGAIAGSVFGYYLWDLRQDGVKPERRRESPLGLRIAATAAILAVVLTVIGSVALIGGPSLARMRKLDQQRVRHLSSIASKIDAYWNLRGELPPDLETFAGARTNAPPEVHDPVTQALYEYRPGVEGSYELCAVFESEERKPQIHSGRRFWGHPAGRHCFEIQAEQWNLERG